MRIGIASDHGGFALKELLRGWLSGSGHEVVDCGTGSEAPVDYPDFALPVAEGVASGRFERGVLVCGTGIGMSMAANRVPGVRAALVHDETTARLAAQHNLANVLCLGGRLVAWPLAADLVRVWLDTPFEERHRPRLEKMAAMERRGAGEGGGGQS